MFHTIAIDCFRTSDSMNYKHITWKGYILPQKAHNLRMLTKTKDQNTACSVCPRTTQKFPLFPNQFNSYETKINKPRCPQPLLTAHGPRVKVKIQLLPINSHSGRLMIEMHHKEKKNCYRKKKKLTQRDRLNGLFKDSGTTGLQRTLTR